MRTLMALSVVAVAVCAAGGQDDKGDKERKKFHGNWVLVSGQVDGKPIADEHVKASKMTIDPDTKVTAVTPHQSKETIKAKITRVDPTKKPAEMDWVRAAGPGKEKTMPAIYEWIDEDSYRIVFDPSCKERPKDFKAAAGSGHILHLWKRTK
jgi:uncharacterized protein (TIGR03067 family)